MSRSLSLSALAALCVVAAPAFAQSDRTTFDQTVARTAQHCPGHNTEVTGPGLRKVSISALRVLLAQRILVCPDRRLDAEAPVVWYGGDRVFAWNPDIDGAIDTLAEQIGGMTRTEAFPTQTLVWSIDGTALESQTVPAFEARPAGAAERRW